MLRCFKIIVFFISSLILCVPLFATELNNSDPVVTITKPSSYTTRRILLFPLNLPAIAVKAATIPVGVTIDLIEKKHLVEKTADLLSNKDKTFWVYPIIEGGAGSNFGGGLGAKHFDLFNKNYQLNVNYRTRINLDQYSDANLSKDNLFSIFDKPVNLRVDNNVRYLGGSDFYGIGPDSQKSNHAKFEYTYVNTASNLAFEFANNFFFELNIGFMEGSTGTSHTDGYKSVNEVFNTDEIFGFGEWINYFMSGVRLRHDTTDGSAFPERGGIQSFSLKGYQPLNTNNASFIEYELAFKHYINLLKPERVLVLHGAWLSQQHTKNSKIPFYLLATIDNSSPVRGFQRFRFRDNNSAVLNIEYRMPVWKYTLGAIFYDMGQVFSSPANFEFNNMKYSGGAALYIHAFKATIFNLTLAYGGEGLNVMFGMSKTL